MLKVIGFNIRLRYIEIYWDYWRVLKVWMEGQAFQLTDVPWYPRPTFWHSSSSICSVATWRTGNGFCPWPSLGAPRNVWQNPASHRRKTSKNIGKTMSIFWKLPHSTCFNGDGLDMPRQADPQIHHHPSSSIVIPSSPALFRSSIISISCSFLGRPDSNGSKVPRTSAALGPLGVRSTRLMTNMTHD